MTPIKAHQLFGFFLLIIPFAQLGVSGRSRGITDGQDLITETCRKTLYVDVCVSSLESDPRSRAADVEGLAAIALNLSMAHGSETILHLRNLNGQGDAYVEGCLRDCVEEYSDAVENLRQSTEALGEKSYETVNELVTGAMTDSDTCEEGFKEKDGYVSPLTERNEYFSKLCSNALAITNLLA